MSTAPGSSDLIQTTIVVLLIVTILFWLVVGFLQFIYAFDPFRFDLLLYAGANVVFSIFTCFLIVPVYRRQKNALEWLYFLAIGGALFGMFQILFGGAYLQICVVPLYILLAILGYTNRQAFV